MAARSPPCRRCAKSIHSFAQQQATGRIRLQAQLDDHTIDSQAYTNQRMSRLSWSGVFQLDNLHIFPYLHTWPLSRIWCISKWNCFLLTESHRGHRLLCGTDEERGENSHTRNAMPEIDAAA